MSEKLKNRVLVILTAVFFLGFFIWCLVKPTTAVSTSERRPLATMPALSGETLWNGRFMTAFEDYATDQFPLRDAFRSVKAFTAYRVFQNKDVNKIYMDADGYLSKLEYPLDESSVENAAKKFMNIYEKHLNKDGVQVYLSVIPDKNRFMAEACGALALDYDAFVAALTARTPAMTYIDIFDLLSLEDYYRTDTHWRQEKIADVAARLAAGMGREVAEDYRTVTVDVPFTGVYGGQAALKVAPEELRYLTNGTLEGLTVFDYETNAEIPVYDLKLAEGTDGYDIFLSGSKSMLKIENPAVTDGSKLVIFRDSFGSSLAPLLAAGYGEIDVVDIRYLSSEMIDRFVTFENCDVLFIYSTLVLNNSITLK